MATASTFGEIEDIGSREDIKITSEKALVDTTIMKTNTIQDFGSKENSNPTWPKVLPRNKEKILSSKAGISQECKNIHHKKLRKKNKFLKSMNNKYQNKTNKAIQRKIKQF